MAICTLSSSTSKGTKLSIDINYHPIRKRYSPGIVLKKGNQHNEENKAKKELFGRIVNEWEWLLLHASQDEVLKVYNLKAGEKTKNLYKSISIEDVLKQIRGQKADQDSPSFIHDSDAPASIKGATANKSRPALSEIDFFAFYDQQHAHRRPHESYQTIKKKIREFHGSDGALPIKEITKQWVKDFIVFMRKSAMGRKTLNEKKSMSENSVTLYFNHLRTILQEAVEQEIIPFNAAWLIARKDRPRIKRSDADSLTFEEIQSLAIVERPRIPREGQLLFLFSCFTGLRLSDCVSLKWNQIYSVEENGEKKYRIRVKQIKTQTRMSNSLSDSALTIIEQRKLENEETGMQSDYVFPKYCPERMKIDAAKCKINVQIKRWGLQAKIDHRMHFHLARHTYATLLMEQGNDIAVVQQLLGHKDIRATMIYAHVSSRRKDIAVNSLPKIGSEIFEREENEKPKTVRRVAANSKHLARKQSVKTKKKK